MRRKLRNTVIFILCLVGLQQGLSWLSAYHIAFGAQKAMILERDMDPAVFFYTESEQALEAEKVLRKRLDNIIH